jgi:N-acetylmuramoyl-L-alanine amidase
MAQAITLAPTADGPLAGKTVLVDPGHNGANWAHPEVINQQVPDGRSGKSCDTTGTATASGYAESAFSFDVAQRLQVLLRNAGATVVMTRSNNSSVGPCVNSRAALGDGADVAISIHGDGGPSSGHGFAVLVPVATSVNRAIVSSSLQLGHDIVTAFSTVMPVSTYLGSSGVQVRSDLAGLNLSTVPKVFIECGNMRNAGDAATMASANWRQSAASSLATSITNFLTRGN